IGRFTGSQIEGGDKTMTRAQSADHQIKCVRQTLFKFVEALCSLVEHEEKWRRTKQHSDQQREDHDSGSQIEEIGRYKETGDGHEDQTARRPVQIGLIKQSAQARCYLEPQEPAIEQ